MDKPIARVSQESEYLMEPRTRTRGQDAIAAQEEQLTGVPGIFHPVAAVDRKEPVKPGFPKRTIEWVWACVSCERWIFLWSKARPVKCVSGCDSYGWKVLLKQYPNEAEDAFLARFARRDVTT